MINLIPPAARRVVFREYWLRVVVVWLFLIGFAGIIITALSAPAFFLIYTQSRAVSDEYADVQVQQEALAEAESAIKETNQIADYLHEATAPVSLFEVYETLERLSGSHVTLSELRLTREGDGLGEITVSGVAATRSALATFSTAIEAKEWFDKADIPISDLAQDTAIDFTITIIPAKLSNS